ncbi:MAG: hypothetical protein QXQ40_01770 [Candidatus Aenigmatarchaeota archaeon]
MKLLIIGQEERTPTDLEILNRAKRFFDSTLYVPFSRLSMNVDGKVIYKRVDFNKFDAILPRISPNKKMFAYSILKALNLYSPISAYTYLITYNRFVMLEILNKKNIPTIKAYLLNSSKSFSGLDISYPVSVRVPNKKGVMLANNRIELKPIIDALESEEPIHIEEIWLENYTQAYVVGDEVFGIKRRPKEISDILFGKGKPSECKLKPHIREIALRAAIALRTEFARVDILKDRVLNVELTPSIKKVEEIINKSIIDKLLLLIRDSVSKRRESIFDKLIDEVRSAFGDVFK